MSSAFPRAGDPHRFRAAADPPRRALATVVATGIAVWIAAGAAIPAQAQTIKPWVPPDADSLLHWASEARLRFRANTGDSIGGENFRAYDLVGRMGRRLLRSLGRDNMNQAPALQAVLDSLGLDTHIQVDPGNPHFALLMVRNPHRRTAKAVGFLYWYREEDLRMQGAQFAGASPQMRVWWTGANEAPYSWGVVDQALGSDPTLRFTLFRLHPGGMYWNLVQYEDSGVRLGSSGSASWVDVNGDQRFELTAWVPAEPDSLFDECPACPKRVNELVFVERPEGFRLLDTRLLPTPYSTFTLFVRLLLDGNRDQAARLVKDPGLVARALAAGWGARRAWRTWLVEESEPGVAWPQWLFMRFKGPQGDRRYRVDFEMSRGRWLIRDWSERQVQPERGARPAAPGGPGR